MSRRCCTHRIPRGFIDPISSRTDALAVLSIAAPFGNDTVAILLDPERRGIGIIMVTGTIDPDTLFWVIDLCIEARYPNLAGLVLASARPGGDMEAADRERWIEATLHCDDAGIELVEWFVIGEHIACPRDLAGEPSRWSSR
jgi:DNA repair protein RadC